MYIQSQVIAHQVDFLYLKEGMWQGLCVYVLSVKTTLIQSNVGNRPVHIRIHICKYICTLDQISICIIITAKMQFFGTNRNRNIKIKNSLYCQWVDQLQNNCLILWVTIFRIFDWKFSSEALDYCWVMRCNVLLLQSLAPWSSDGSELSPK